MTKRNDKPTKAWSGKCCKASSGESELESLWSKCLENDLVDVRKADKEDTAEMVSIRCRRHKKRFTVERSWLDTCRWLCPKCYGKLSKWERMMYAPKTEEIDLRPLVYDIKTEENPVTYKEIKEDGEKAESGLNFHVSPKMQALLPLWRMRCKKCDRVLPVHKTFIDNSSAVLCPECFSNMSSSEVSEFHLKNPRETAQVWNVKPTPVAETSAKPSISPKPLLYSTLGESSDVAPGGYYSSKRIASMSVKEIYAAVKLGRMSKARARIEIRRRKSEEYFNWLPEVMPVSLSCSN